MLELLEKSSELQVDKEADDLLPSIELTAGYRIEGDEYSLKNEDNLVFAGVSLSFPFSDQVEEAEHLVSKIQADKRKLTNESVTRQLQLDSRSLFEQMIREEALKSIAERKIKLAKSVLKDETENYTFGKVTLNDYIDAVNVLDSNRFSLIRRRARLRRLRIEWLRLSDRLVQEKEVLGH